jgi:hypothetical protein
VAYLFEVEKAATGRPSSTPSPRAAGNATARFALNAAIGEKQRSTNYKIQRV